MSGRIIATILGKGRGFPALGHCPHFRLLTVPLNCHGTSGGSFHLLIEDQGLVLPVNLAPFDSNQFMLCPWALSFFEKLRPAPFPPVTNSGIL